MATAISIENVSKSYRLGLIGTGTLREDLQGWWHRVRGLPDPNRRVDQSHLPVEGHTLWALQDVSLEIQPGEILGIIGRNGAGKSTLLKILSRVTAPTSGRIRVKGRVASLLEVGTGFHPELTGRENIFLNGAILGMTKAEVAKKFDEIVDFSEIEQFIDTPVKRYSSGMYVRLAFAVAAHLDPEILVVDEVLAVGDAAFQKKCLGKMDEAGAGGRTILFVTHNMIAAQSLCKRTVWLDRGRVMEDGATAAVVSRYLRNAWGAQREKTWDERAQAPGNDTARLRKIRVVPQVATPSDVVTMATPFAIEIEYEVMESGTMLHVAQHLINEQGLIVLTSGEVARIHPAGRYKAVCHMPGNLLNSGKYSLNIYFLKDNSKLLFRHDGVVSFDVVDTQEREIGFMVREPGVVQPVLKWDWIEER
ncbi:MAG: ABC transporter ATP-binding protein [Opitutae bacterium]|nr:ABC transporter ATP-binding protein [Opitutae bacterium]